MVGENHRTHFQTADRRFRHDREFSPVWPAQAGLRDTQTVDQAELRLELRSLELSPFFPCLGCPQRNAKTEGFAWGWLGGPVKGKCFPTPDT